MLAALTGEDLFLILVILAVLCFVGAVYFVWRRDFPPAVAATVLGVVLLLVAD